MNVGRTLRGGDKSRMGTARGRRAGSRDSRHVPSGAQRPDARPRALAGARAADTGPSLRDERVGAGRRAGADPIKPNWVGIVGWQLLLAAILIPFVSPIGAINGRALLVFVLAAGGVVLVDQAWQIPSRNALRATSTAETRRRTAARAARR